MASAENTLEIIASNLHGCSSTVSTRFQYGIKKTFENAGGDAQIVLMSETMSDAKLPLQENHAAYVIKGDRPGTGMCASINPDRLPIFKVVEITHRLQLIEISDRLNIISLYAPQVGSPELTKSNFCRSLAVLLEQIDKSNDKPILLTGDFNIEPSELPSSYLGELLQHGSIISSGKPTQLHGKELDFAVMLKAESAEFSVSSEVLQNATSDHEAIRIIIKNFNTVLDQDLDLITQKPNKSPPIPKGPNQIKAYKTLVKKEWHKFLTKNSRIESILKRTLAQESKTCNCNAKHKELLDLAYRGMREIIINSAEKVSRMKKVNKKKCNIRNPIFEKLHQRLQRKEIGKKRFIKLLKFKTNQQNQKNYKFLAKNSKSINYYKKLKKMMGANLKTRKPRIPLKGITKIYREIYEPVSFDKSKVKNLKVELKKPKINESTKVKKFNRLELDEAMELVKKKKASRGPKIEHWVMADINDQIMYLFNAFMIHGHVPKQLLTANIVCLKKDHSLPDNVPTNYRPIALVESLSKVLEQILRPRIEFSFSKNQYAYQENKGTLNALNDFITSAKIFKRKYGTVFCVFLDLSKAFDKLDFEAIASQMKGRMEFPERRVFAEYLTNTCTMLEDVQINPRRGIRQGGLLSPSIFLQTTDPWLREHEYQEDKGAKAQGFADDTAILGGIVFRVQEFLDSFSTFAEKNGLQLNPKKCKVVACCTTADFEKYSQGLQLPEFLLNGIKLEYVRVYKYLGYLYNSAMSDSDHMRELLSRIRTAILQNKRFFKKANIWLLVRIAKTFIVSKLYGLEFSESISNHQITRYNYLFNAWFSKNSERTNQIIKQNEQISLKYLHEKARSRRLNLE